MKNLNFNYLLISILCCCGYMSLQAQNICDAMSINTTSIAVTNTNDSGFGSLRQAIICTNTESTYFRIEFQITSAPPHVINVTANPLPLISSGVTIDATTNGLSPGDVIIRDNGGFFDGLAFIDGLSAIYGLQIEGFGGPTFGAGIFLSSPFCRVTIGGIGRGNIITNNRNGIDIRGEADALIYGNTISNNTLRGIYVPNALTGNTFVKIGNERRPISSANIISGNDIGVEVNSDASRILMNVNSFSCNQTEAIRLDNAIEPIPSPPVIVTADENGVSGTATPGDSVYVFLSENENCTAAPCQGSRFLGRAAAPNGTWTLSNANIETNYSFLEGGNVTALALRPIAGAATCAEEFPPIRSYPSEFANCRAITTPCLIIDNGTTVVVTNTNDEGDGSLREAINCANSIPELDNIVFDFQQGSAPFVINVGATSGSLLPGLFDENITIDGTINDHNVGDIILDGSALNLQEEDGLFIRGNGIRVYGLHFRNFDAAAGSGIYAFSGENIALGTTNKGNIFTNNRNGIEGNATSLTIVEALIGVEANGVTASGNLENGIFYSNTSGDLSVINSTIAYNQTGLSANTPDEVAVVNTSIYCNTNTGLNLPNSSQPIPEITEASPTLLSGTGSERIEIYKHDNQGCSGNPPVQGRTLVGVVDAVNGIWSLNSTNFEPGVSLSNGDVLVATSTDAFTFFFVIYVNTSPYSNPVSIVDPCFSSDGGTTIEVTNDNDTGAGSLRQAILCANADPQLDRIIFNIPGVNNPEVQPQDELPIITDDGIIIDGTTQNGGVVLECSDLAYFRVTGADFEVRGIEFINFDTWAVYIESGDDALIENNIFDGEFGNFTRPVRINSDGATVRNNIFKNANDGMFITGNGAVVGGNSFAEANYFYNCDDGLVLFQGDFHKVYFNYFGINENNQPQGNTNAGVRIMEGTSNCLINDNEIGNNEYGIFLSAPDAGISINNTFSTNMMYCNRANGIELSASTNNNQQIPIIENPTTNQISGTGDAGERIEVFIHEFTGCTGAACQGRIFIGSTNVQGDGTWSISPNQTLSIGMQVTATATDGQGNTSEFTACSTVVEGCAAIDATTVEVTNTFDSGAGSLRHAIDCVNNDETLDHIVFNLTGTAPFIFQPDQAYPILLDDGITIDGTTQAGNIGDIIIDGSFLTNQQTGIEISGANIEIYGLTFRNFTGGNGIVIQPFFFRNGGNSLNTNITIGDIGKGNEFYSGNNGFRAIRIIDGDQVSIKSNFIGTNAAATTALPLEGQSTAILVDLCPNLFIGGSNPGEGNTIGACRRAIEIVDCCNNGWIRGNFFGTNDENGTINLGTQAQAIFLDDTGTSFEIGGTNPSDGNTFAYAQTTEALIIRGNPTGLNIQNNRFFENDNAGIRVLDTATDISILDNEFHDNETGIILGALNPNQSGILISRNSMFCNLNGIILNDANNNQPAPSIEAALPNSVSGTANTGETIELFIHDNADCPLATCQGRTFLGTTIAQNGTWQITPSMTLSSGTEVTAVSIDNSNNSSEFAACFMVCEAIMVTAENNGPYCEGDIIELIGTTSDATPPVIYRWSGPQGYSSDEQNPTDATLAGTYTLVVADNCSTAMDNTEVIINPSPTANATALSACADNGDMATFDLTQLNAIINGGTNNVVNFYIDDNTNNLISNPSQYTSASTLIFATQTANNCESPTVPITLTATTLMVTCSEQNPPSTPGGSDGVGEVTIGGNGSSYTYEWRGAVNGSEVTDTAGTYAIPNLPEGAYQVIVTDLSTNGSCRDTCDFTITSPNCDLVIEDVLVENIVCNGDSTGRIAVQTTGGFGALTYEWTPDVSTSNTATNLPAGTYIVSVQDTANCEVRDTINIIEPSILEVACEGDTLDTPQSTNGIGQITILGSTAPYIYSYTSNGVLNTETADTAGTYVINDLTAGIYTVTVLDANQCQDSCDIIIVSPNCDLAFEDVLVENILCNGDSTGRIAVQTTGGFGALTYEWTPDVSTTNIATNLPAGTYIVSVQDTANCEVRDTINIIEPSILEVTCEGDTLDTPQSADGMGQITISGSNAPYIYSYTSNGVLNTETADTAGTYFINDLTAGIYTVTVLDANQCQDSCDIIIVSPNCDLVIEDVLVENILCNGDSTGRIAVQTTGGFGALTYEWTPDVSTTNIATNLPAGTYIVSVQDTANCEIRDTINIIEPSILEVACEGDTLDTPQSTNGIGQITISGSTAPYIYSYTSNGVLNTETADTAGTYFINDLTAGIYTVTVLDANQCQDSCDIIIVSPNCDLVIEDVLVENIMCNGDSTGRIAVQTTGGFGALTYEWTLDVSTTNIATNLPAGTYIVSVQDTANCEVRDTINIIEPSILEVTCEGDTLDTPQSTNGIGQITILGSTAPYTYNYIANGVLNTATADTAGTYFINDLTAGTFTVTVLDANQCQDSCDVIIVSPNCDLVIEDVLVENIVCNGDSTGRIAVQTTGGFGALTYEWTPDVSTTNIATNLPAGTYIVSVQDTANCEVRDTINIIEPSILEVACEGDTLDTPQSTNGIGQITILGSTAPYIYSYTSNGVLITETADTAGTYFINDLTAETYTVTVLDANQCQDSCDIIIVSPNCDLVIEDVLVENILCNGDSTGRIAVQTTGGFGALTYEWTPDVSTTNIATNLPAGTYIVSVQDTANCEVRDTINIIEPSILEVTCEGDTLDTPQSADGMGQITISGSNAPYIYSYTSNGVLNTETADTAGTYFINDLTAGIYTVTVLDANQCQDSCDIIIVSPNCDLVIEDVLVENIVCNGDSTGRIEIQTTGGFGALTYEWTPNVSTTNIANNLPAGTYMFTVRDTANCEVRDTINIIEPSMLEVVCEGDTLDTPQSTDGIGQITISGSTAPYIYSYTSNGVLNTETADTAGTYFINDLTAGTYTVTVMDANQCQDSCDVIIVSPNCDLVIEDILIENIVCNGDSTGRIEIQTTGGFGALTYEWTPNVSTTNIANNLPAGTYMFTVRDTANCEVRDTINIIEPSMLEVVCEGDTLDTPQSTDGIGQITISGSTAPYIYSYTSNGVLNTETADTAGTYFINDLTAGTYTVTVMDANQCQDSCSIPIQNPEVPDTVIFNASSTSTLPGSPVCLDISVQNFNNIGMMSYSMTWDATVLEFDTIIITNQTWGLDIDDFDFSEVANGILSVQWDTQSENGVSFQDNTVLYEVCFRAIGQPGESSTFVFTNDGTDIIVVNNNDDDVPNNFDDNGGVSILGDDCTLQIDTILITNLTCNASDDGALAVQISGNDGEVIYDWNINELDGNANPTNLAAGIYSLTITDESNCIDSALVVINQPPVTDVILTGSNDICAGESTPLNFNFNGTAPFTVSYSDGETQSTFTAEADTTIMLNPTMSSTYSIINLTDGNACTGNGQGSAIVTVREVPVVGETTTACNGETYTVSFEILSGTPPFGISGWQGTLEDNVFTSEPIPATMFVYSFDINNDCSTTNITGFSPCADGIECSTEAGTMANEILRSCANESITAVHNLDDDLDENDVLQFVLHDSADTTLGTIFALNNNPEFSLSPGMDINQTYYISAIAGNDDGFGNVDFFHPCTVLSEGTPVEFLPAPPDPIFIEATDSIICENTPLTLRTVNYADTAIVYHWINPQQAEITTAVPTLSYTGATESNAGAYQVFVTLGTCVSPVTDSVVIEILDVPGAFAEEDFVECDGDNSTFIMAEQPDEGTLAAWTVLTPTVRINDRASPEAQVSNLQFGDNHFLWTVSNDACTVYDTLTVNYAVPPIATDFTETLDKDKALIRFLPYQAENLFGLDLILDSTLFIIPPAQPRGLLDFDEASKWFVYTKSDTLPQEEFAETITFDYVICNPVPDCDNFCDTATITLNVRYDNSPDILVYGLITPNNDNVNDQLEIEGIDQFPLNKLVIVNRWGDIVYQKDNYGTDADRWEGRFKNSAKILPQAAYYYYLEFKRTENDPWREATGVIHVINK